MTPTAAKASRSSARIGSRYGRALSRHWSYLLESLIKNFVVHLGQVIYAARFALSYQVLTARSAARMDLAIGTSASIGSGEIIANPVRSERL